MSRNEQITCRFCTKFCLSKWRITADPDEEGKKKIAKDRHCPHIDKYVSGEREICEDGFIPYHLFYCDNENCWQHVEACLSRSQKGISEVCFGCKQHAVIMMVQRKRHFYKLKLQKFEEEETKPKLVRRK